MPAAALADVPVPATASRPTALPAPRPVPLHLVPSASRRPAGRPLRHPQSEPRPVAAPVPTGRELLDRLAAGDDRAWRETVARFESLLRSRARAVLRADADVDEAVQRTWVLLLRHAAAITDVDRLPGWLATTARREALAIVRQQQRETVVDDLGEAAPVDDADIATDLLDGELLAALDRAVDTLPQAQRVVVRAMLRGTASYDELSRELGVPRGSLGPLRGRAVRALRAQLAPAFA